MFYLLKNKYWKEFFLKMMAESNSSKYYQSREEVMAILGEVVPSDLHVDLSGKDSVCLKIKGRTDKPIESGWFPIDYLERIDEIGKEAATKDDILPRLERKRDRVKHYKEQIEDLKERIETEENEIKNLESWLAGKE